MMRMPGARSTPPNPDGEPAVDVVARLAERLGVLLLAGVTPRSAWMHLAEAGGAGARTSRRSDQEKRTRRMLIAVSQALEHGSGAVGDVIDDAVSGAPHGVRSRRRDRTRVGELRRSRTAATRTLPVIHRGRGPARDPVAEAWRGVAAVWRVADESGAPIAASLCEIAEALRDAGETEREVLVALAGPRAAATVVTALPAVGVALSAFVGVDTVGVLTGTLLGGTCLVVGVALVIGGWAWTRALVARATPRTVTPGLFVDLVSVALAGSGSPDRAIVSAEAAYTRGGSTVPEAERDVVTEVLRLARSAGVPAGRLLRSEATALRRSARAAARRAAATLGTTVMLPLGVCSLPAFVLLGIAPVVIAIVSSTVSGMSDSPLI